MPPKRILLSWSGGKDSAWALHLLQQDPTYEVVASHGTEDSKAADMVLTAERCNLVALDGDELLHRTLPA